MTRSGGTRHADLPKRYGHRSGRWSPDCTTGEPDEFERFQSGSEGGGGNGALRQPRRPPTLCASFYVSCNHALSAGSHSVDVSGATGRPEVERPNGRKQPARVKSHGKPESIRRPRGEPRPAWSRLHCCASCYSMSYPSSNEEDS